MNKQLKSEFQQHINTFIQTKNDEEAFLQLHSICFKRKCSIIDIFKLLFESSTSFSIEQLDCYYKLFQRFHFYPQILSSLITSSKQFQEYQKLFLSLFKAQYLTPKVITETIGDLFKDFDMIKEFFSEIMKDSSMTPISKIEMFHFIHSNVRKGMSEEITSKYLEAIEIEMKNEEMREYVSKLVLETWEIFIRSKEGRTFLSSYKDLHRKIIDNYLIKISSLSGEKSEKTTELLDKSFSNLFYMYDKTKIHEIFIQFYQNVVSKQLEQFSKNDYDKIVEIIESKFGTKLIQSIDKTPFITLEICLKYAISHESIISDLIYSLKDIPSLLKSYLIHRLYQLYLENKTLSTVEIQMSFGLSPFAEINYFTDSLEVIFEMLKQNQFIYAFTMIKELVSSIARYNAISSKDIAKINPHATTRSNLSFYNKITPSRYKEYDNSKKCFYQALKNNKCIFYILHFLTELKIQYKSNCYSENTMYDIVNDVIIKYLNIIDSVILYDSFKSYIDHNESEMLSILNLKDEAIFWKTMKYIIPHYQKYDQWKSVSITNVLSNKQTKPIEPQQNDVYLNAINSKESVFYKQVFWLLELEDIYYPEQLYKINSDSLKTSKGKEYDIYQKDMTAHKTKNEILMKSLQTLTNPIPQEIYAPFQFLLKCLIPRMKLSIKDALYCAEFVLQLFDNNIHCFSLLFLWNDISMYLLTSTYTMTIKETENVGYFLRVLLKKLNEWKIESKYLSEVKCKIGFKNPSEVEYESFIFVYNKWQKLLEEQLIVMLTSKEEFEVMKGLAIYQCIVKEFKEKETLKAIVGLLANKSSNTIKSRAKSIYSTIQSFDKNDKHEFMINSDFKSTFGMIKMSLQSNDNVQRKIEKQWNELRQKHKETVLQLRETKIKAIQENLQQRKQNQAKWDKMEEEINEKEKAQVELMKSKPLQTKENVSKKDPYKRRSDNSMRSRNNK